MNSRVFPIGIAAALACAAATRPTVASIDAQDHLARRSITWEDLAPLRADLERHGIMPAAFPSYVEGLRQTHAARMREGDLDHLVFYLLQSTRFTSLPPIDPALSAKALVDSLDPPEREVFLRGEPLAISRVPAAVQARTAALLHALDRSSADPRLAYFRELTKEALPGARSEEQREAALLHEYMRAMRFVYEKEFIAGRDGGQAVAKLYRDRGLSTDTAVEAGYVVYQGLGVVKSLDPTRRIRRVLIIGPGLDLAPRTALLEVGPPESYQPWEVIDALVSLGLARLDDLEVVCMDINPRVVGHLRRSRREPPELTLVTSVEGTEGVALSPEYREYFSALGRAIGEPVARPRPGVSKAGQGRLVKTVRVSSAAASVLRSEMLDIVTDRLEDASFDLAVATNVLPYFDDRELMLAVTNVSAMLAPGGLFLHNESRPLLGDVSAAMGLPYEQSRHVTIATVRGAPAPLYDSVWLHRKARGR